MVKINSEAWLPSEIQGHGSLRYLLFFGFNGEVRITCTDYRKFQATSTILPGARRSPCHAAQQRASARSAALKRQRRPKPSLP